MKQLSTHAATAKAIRQELKKAFPLIKFSVTSDSFSGGDSVRVKWNNGPTIDMVSKIISKYQYGHFDGMYDIYEHSNNRSDIPQVKYVQWDRDISEDIMQSLFEKFRTYYDGWENLSSMDESNYELMKKWSAWTAREFIYRTVSKEDLTHGYKGEK